MLKKIKISFPSVMIIINIIPAIGFNTHSYGESEI